ncbi:UDP-N-acetylmuramoyl-tripeptide--D-alanyl-D-alanine ligase [Parvularcula sp. LCG005]|uniref:UDP-N-acetylmuramoyl-tripeptide--D-alanyl-D- alanine ligase n=1 Tax=Parvularcula sp. LCG005 TaxID=3078805 RepID=UPI002941DE54|nr:UDP-N-acetylmuramoyl-tripeptide--D-alanyl-D-alanine ligase [Parvularcula sp. LCG005]WOI52127.1 UDP-N-acetylmuramoyl-tripeptide--D-alanyl-D-alanine ligase [Parvularcula sp. LCG005]
MSVLSTTPLWTALEARAATCGQLAGGDEWVVSGLSIDTRTLRSGEMFVALKDARDGHDFIQAAREAGATAALASDATAAANGPALMVEDTLTGLSALAAAARDRNFGKLIAVTGSAGKTSTKEMLRAALAPSGKVHAAQKSFNNHIGVPLTLAALPANARFGVFEIGMNHAGEITPLVGLVRPHVAIITTIAAAHLEFFDSVDGIAAAKAEILTGLRPGGVAVLPADSDYYDFLCDEAGRNGVTTIIPFGESARAQWGVRLLDYDPDGAGPAKLTVSVEGEKKIFTLDSPGRHQASNACAVIAAALASGATVDSVIAGLERFAAGSGRGATHVMTIRGATVHIIDESYNANPASMAAALKVLGTTRQGTEGRRIAVLGEMRELGKDSDVFHRQLTTPIAEAGVDMVYTAGPGMVPLRDALGSGVHRAHAEQALDLIEPLLADLQDGDIVLFKGSNASRVGPLLDAFLSNATMGE